MAESVEERDLRGGMNIKGHPVGEVLSRRVVNVLVLKLLPHNATKEAPNPPFAKASALKSDRVVSVREGESRLAHVSTEQTNLLGEGHDIVRVHDVRAFPVEGSNPSLVGVAADGPVRNLDCSPDTPELMLPLPNDLVDPNFVGIGNGETFSLGCVPVGLHEMVHGGDSLPGSSSTLERDPDQASIVNDTSRVGLTKILKTPECSLPDAKPNLVAVTNYIVGRTLGLRNVAQVGARIPIINIALRGVCR
mmetsp:Transcript_3897/g.7855  ORF Transcript_3897/g.7855 Transcript_3897/m.7855 type:complete len:249 (+) Transcript_3897:947-1693(+)